MISSYSSFSDATDNSAFCNKKTATKFSADYCFCENCDETKDYPAHIYIRAYLTCAECGFLRDECECLSFLYSEDFMAELGYNMPSISHDEGWTGSLGVTTCEPRSAFEKAYYDYFGVLFSPDASIAAAVAEAMPFGCVHDSNLEDVVDDPQDFSVDHVEDYYENLADYYSEGYFDVYDCGDGYNITDLTNYYTDPKVREASQKEAAMNRAKYALAPLTAIEDDPEEDELEEDEPEDESEEELEEDELEEDQEDADENMDDLPHEILSPLKALHQFMRNSGVRYAWYLFERSWFCRSQSLQELTVKVILSGKASEINVAAGDFDEHLEDLLAN